MNGMRTETLSPPRPFPKSFIGVDNRFHTRVSSPGTGTIVDPHRQNRRAAVAPPSLAGQTNFRLYHLAFDGELGKKND